MTTSMSWVHWLGITLAFATCQAQIFPFSNLKHIFEHKGKGGASSARTTTTPNTPTFAPTVEVMMTTTAEPPTTTGLAPHYGPYSLFEEDDDGFREFQRPDLINRVQSAPKLTKPVAKVPKQATYPKQSTQPKRIPHLKQTDHLARPVDSKQRQQQYQQHEQQQKQLHQQQQHEQQQKQLHQQQQYHQQHEQQQKRLHQQQQQQYHQQNQQQQIKQKKRLVENHSRPSHLVPIKIAYEPTTPSSPDSGDVHELSGGDGHLQPINPPPPPLYLMPPPMPANNPADQTSSYSSPHASRTTEGPAAPAAAAPTPPVPALYLRPPPPPGPSGATPEPILFKLDAQHGGVKLQLADVADAAMSHSTNPGVLRESERRPSQLANSTPATPSNHKLTYAPHNALGARPHGHGPGGHAPGLGVSKLNAEFTNHQEDKYTGSSKDLTHKALPPVESSAAESNAAAIALGPPQRTPGNHRPGLRPGPPQHQPAPRAPKFRNHKPGPVGPPQPVKYLNHRPGGLDGEESMTNMRYRKRPLGSIEQEVAATGIQHTGKYPSSGDGDRVEFQMHGLQGPESYKFGYDTGNGQNRQFRYEERDPHGNVKGHYGYVDQNGKLQVVNYKADSKGYSADVSKLHT